MQWYPGGFIVINYVTSGGGAGPVISGELLTESSFDLLTEGADPILIESA